MATFDIKVISGGYGVREYRAEDQSTASNRSATLKPGEPVKVAGTGTNFVDIVATGDPEVGTDELVGVVAKESTDTSSADGVVLVQEVGANTVLRGAANDSTAMDTAAELNGLINDWVTFDVDGSNNVTIDENEGTDPNVHGLKIVDGDIDRGTLDVMVHVNATSQAPITGQTMDQ